MKKWFLLFSNIVCLIILATTIHFYSDQMMAVSYPMVHVSDASTEFDQSELHQTIQELAKENHSTVGKQIFLYGQDGKRVAYRLYGEGKFPNKIQTLRAEQDPSASVNGNYLIFSGSLTLEQLEEALKSPHYKVESLERLHPVAMALSIYDNNLASFISMGIFILAYFAILFFESTEKLRKFGIQMISGYKRSRIFRQTINKEVKLIGICMLLTFILALLVLLWLDFFIAYIILSVLLGLLVYNLILVLLAIGVYSLFIITSRKKQLISLVKGKMPYRLLICLMMICQFLAVLFVGFNLERAFTSYQSIQLLNQSIKGWDSYQDYYDVNYSQNSLQGLGEEDNEDLDRELKLYFGFVSEALFDKEAIYLRHNIDQGQFGNMGQDPYFDQMLKTLYVNPTYLVKENLPLTKEHLQTLKDLKRREFGLILPKAYHAQRQELEDYYSQYFVKLFGDEEGEALTFKPQTILLESTGNRLLLITDNFLQRSLDTQQLMQDPILVVFTPKISEGIPDSNLFWGMEMVNHIKYKGLKQTQDLIKKHGIEAYIGDVVNSRDRFYDKISGYQSDTIQYLIGAVFACLASLILFYCMNRIYFNQFRRDILIKRIDGMNFWQNHQVYLALQLLIFSLAFSLLFYFVKLKYTLVLTALIFIALSVTTLGIQMKKENRQSLTLLKGA